MFQCTENEFRQHQNDFDGLCLECGEWSCGGCEPDAEEYECEGCGCKAVCGADQALLMGELGFCTDPFEYDAEEDVREY